ncbi:cat eye syndrome critical region protein 2 homolog, partial [Diaphorina citri]|uniref:Cat eye syndrome critical region protein 2 homolog n=1 Tax=Diaphorina citri TaxID=121845 RepID=A0A1S3DJT4_DIACI
ELEEALLTDGTEDTGSSLLQELIVRLLCGCYGRNHGISIFNYQMFLRRLFRTKCREYGRENPFDSDIDFQFLPLRTKVEILQALCDFRLDADDVLDCLKNLESDSLRLQPLGYDRNQSAFWYFYGTRLYREDYPKVDINKWLDDTPRFSEYSNSASNSPSQILGIVEDYESRARIEAEYQRTLSKIDKIDKAARKEALQQKRRLMKEQQAAAALAAAPPPAPPPPKKKREIQRTIERLQPGKSKGNLLSNTSLNKAATEDSAVPTLLPLSKLREKENQLLEEK